jgi:hypothetical protein
MILSFFSVFLNSPCYETPKKRLSNKSIKKKNIAIAVILSLGRTYERIKFGLQCSTILMFFSASSMSATSCMISRSFAARRPVTTALPGGCPLFDKGTRRPPDGGNFNDGIGIATGVTFAGRGAASNAFFCMGLVPGFCAAFSSSISCTVRAE